MKLEPETAALSPQTITGSYTNVAFQVVATKISGTVAGTAILQASLDGTNYHSVGVDTLTLTNVATNAHLWSAAPNKYKYWRVKVTGSGTMSASVNGYAFPVK